eukprot:1101323-Rhodomonas_salina.1
MSSMLRMSQGTAEICWASCWMLDGVSICSPLKRLNNASLTVTTKSSGWCSGSHTSSARFVKLSAVFTRFSKSSCLPLYIASQSRASQL